MSPLGKTHPMVFKTSVPGPDPELVKQQKLDAARSQAEKTAALQRVLRGQTNRTRRRYGMMDLAALGFSPGVGPTTGGGGGGAGNGYGGGSGPGLGGDGGGRPVNPSV